MDSIKKNADMSPSTELAVVAIAAALTHESQYQYEPLDKSIDGLRLLVLLPSEIVDSPIHCELVHSTFRQKPVYEALSYIWGTESPTHCIFIGGHQFYVRENLYSALVHLRLKDKERNLWADAVCIDQGNLEERAYQVSLMDFIYIRASEVLIWLGATIITEAFGSIAQFPGINTRYYISWMRAISSHPYWRRLWIIQEICLARSVTLYIGIAHQKWDDFVKRVPSPDGTYVDNSGKNLYCRGISLIRNLDAKRKGRNSDTNRLEILLEDFDYALCQERKDKIFGLLGLAHDCQDASIEVDYIHGCHKLYCDVIRFFMQREPNANGVSNTFDRSMRLVKFSELILGSLSATHNERGDHARTIVAVRGALVGQVRLIGPSYEDIISSSQANKSWRASISQHFHLPEDRTRLLNANDLYVDRFPKMTTQDIETLSSVYNDDSSINYWSRGQRLSGKWEDEPPNWTSQASDQYHQYDRERFPNNCHPPLVKDQPRIFIGDNFLHGLAPGTVQESDFICQFWQTNKCALLRLAKNNGDTNNRVYRVVGKIDLCGSQMVRVKEHTQRQDSDIKRDIWGLIPTTAQPILIHMHVDLLGLITS